MTLRATDRRENPPRLGPESPEFGDLAGCGF
jgi:hypothetical protein